MMSASIVVDAVLLERGVAQVAPQHRDHAEPMRLLEAVGDLDELPRALLAAEVDRRADPDRPEIPGALHAREQHLVELVRVGEQLVVVDLHDEGDLVRVPAAHRAEHAERRSNRVAAALDRQLDDRIRVEVGRVDREAGPGAVLDALIDGEDAHVPRAAKTAVSEDLLEIAECRVRAVAPRNDAVDEVRSGEMQQRAVDCLAAVREQRVGLVTEQLLDTGESRVLSCERHR